MQDNCDETRQLAYNDGARTAPLIFDRALLRGRRRRAAARAGDVPARPGRGRLCRSACGGAAPVRPGGRYRHPGDAAVWRSAAAAPSARLSRADGAPGGAHAGWPRRRRRRGAAFRDASLDLVVSALALQAVNDLPGALVQIRRVLKPDGLFLAALFGGDTLTELRQSFAAAESELDGGVSPRVAPFADVREMGALLQRAGFALPVTDVDRVTVRYGSGICADARSAPHGRGEPAGRTPPRAASPRDTDAHEEIYAERFAMPTAGCGQASTSSGCRAGRRTRASSSRCGRAPRRRGLPMRSARAKSRRGKRQGVSGSEIGYFSARASRC